MADIIDYIKGDLTKTEKKRLEAFMQEELSDLQDTSCESVDEIREKIVVFFGYAERFKDVFEDPETKINLDFDFGLFLIEWRIRRMQAMLKAFFGNKMGGRSRPIPTLLRVSPHALKQNANDFSINFGRCSMFSRVI